MTPAQNREIAGRIREALAQRRISRQRLADEARISVSTLEKALAGDRPFSLASLVRLEQALGVTLRGASTVEQQVAPPELGSYVRSGVEGLAGEYLTLRPAFDTADCIQAYCTTIEWDASRPCLTFRESQRSDTGNAQIGLVSIPPAKGKIYLRTAEDGESRLAILNSPTRGGELSGLLLTLEAGMPGLPAAAPIVLTRRRPEHVFGRFTRADSVFAQYRAMLAAARRGVSLRDVPA